MIQQWLPALLAVTAWPAAVAVMVLGVVVLVPSAHLPTVLAGIAEIVRAVRGKELDPVPATRPPGIAPDIAAEPKQISTGASPGSDR